MVGIEDEIPITDDSKSDSLAIDFPSGSTTLIPGSDEFNRSLEFVRGARGVLSERFGFGSNIIGAERNKGIPLPVLLNQRVDTLSMDAPKSIPREILSAIQERRLTEEQSQGLFERLTDPERLDFKEERDLASYLFNIYGILEIVFVDSAQNSPEDLEAQSRLLHCLLASSESVQKYITNKPERDAEPLPAKGYLTTRLGNSGDHIRRIYGGDESEYKSVVSDVLTQVEDKIKDIPGDLSVARARLIRIRKAFGKIFQFELSEDDGKLLINNHKLRDFLEMLSDLSVSYPSTPEHHIFLGDIDQKITSGHGLSREELIFLYGTNRRDWMTEGDPSFTEVQARRKSQWENDVCIIFDCEPRDIAHSPDEISETTKVYIGPVAKTRINPQTGEEELLPEYKDIFQKLLHVEHIYTSFPDCRIQRQAQSIGGATSEQLEAQMLEKGVRLGEGVQKMMMDRDFKTLPTVETINLLLLRIRDMGFTTGPITEQLFRRMTELGIDYVPAEAGPHYRLSDMDSTEKDMVFMGMKPIVGRESMPCVFWIDRINNKRWLNAYSAELQMRRFDPSFVFAFRIPKLESSST